MERFTAEEIKLLQPFVSNTDRDIFALRNLPEVVKGALFSRYSRTDKSLRRVLLDEFITNKETGFKEIVSYASKTGVDEVIAVGKAEEFYERVLVGFGDDSIAELAFAHIAVENVSNIAAKIIEDSRIGISPLEKSTRYVYFNNKVSGSYLFYKAPEIMNSGFKDSYLKLMNSLFDAYSSFIEPMSKYAKDKHPKKDGATERAYESSIRAKVCDTIRGMLPVATLTNLGVGGNGRAFEYLLMKLRSYPLKETKEVSKLMQQELKKVIPSFVARVYAKQGDEFSEYFENEQKLFSRFSSKEGKDLGTRVDLVSVKGEEDEVIAGIIYIYGSISYKEALGMAKKMGREEKKQLIDAYFMLRKNRRHKPNRAFELVNYTFDVTANFGAYRDLHRHRVLTQFRQRLTPYLGYDVPDDIKESGFEDKWRGMMEKSSELFSEIEKQMPVQAQYVLPLAYRIRWLMQFNLREAFHLCELRSSEQGHRDYRSIAIKIADEIQKAHPVIGRMNFVNRKESGLERINAEISMDKRLEALRQKYRPTS